MLKRLQNELQNRRGIKAGERLGVAVSGGADSVALLRALHELRTEMGMLLTVLHFNHGIRGAEADQDEAFVEALSKRLGLECILGRGDVPAHAKTSGLSLETAARELRYRFFASVLQSGSVDKIATAHTMDDQAETVLMRTLRGAGTRGLSGIYGEKDAGRFLRPLLGFRRFELEDYLRSLGQEWREDASNSERKHFRNQIRHDLLPLLAKDFNPNIVEVLARSAEVAQTEEEYWAQEMAKLLPLVMLPGTAARGGGRKSSPAAQGLAFDLAAFAKYPVAVQRRLLLAALRTRGIEADSAHVQSILEVANGGAKAAELPGGWKASRSLRELRFERPAVEGRAASQYSYELKVPGEVPIHEINLLVQARLEPVVQGDERYNSGQVPGELLLPEDLAALTVRNWQPGDRFWPGQSKSEKKVKELLQELKLAATERQLWPVVSAGTSVLWVRGLRPKKVWINKDGKMYRLVVESRSGMQI